jgi:hypothetical protein
MMKLTNSRVIGICLIVSASFFASSSTYADSITLKACVKKSNGATRIISGKMKCVKTERQVTLSSTTDNSTSTAGVAGEAGAIGATGATGAAGATGATGATGLQGPAGVAGADGVDGTNGTNGVNGISKALIASGNQVSINQGSAGTVLSFTVPAGKYVMDFSSSVAYSNANTSMAGPAQFSCFITESSTYTDASTNAQSNYWPELSSATPVRISFESIAATSDEIMKRSFAGSTVIDIAQDKTLRLICRHFSEIADDTNEKVTIRYPRIILTAVNELVTLSQ